MDAAAHHVVHHVVTAGDIGKDTVNHPGLFGLIDRLEPEMRGSRVGPVCVVAHQGLCSGLVGPCYRPPEGPQRGVTPRPLSKGKRAVPELPEVETVRRGLAPVLEGAVIARAQVNRPDLRWPFPERMADRLSGARVDRLRRRSKYILADLSTDETLIIHLGMSGRMIISAGQMTRVAPGEFHHSHPAHQKNMTTWFLIQMRARASPSTTPGALVPWTLRRRRRSRRIGF
jgi:hypothetical protein